MAMMMMILTEYLESSRFDEHFFLRLLFFCDILEEAQAIYNMI